MRATWRIGLARLGAGLTVAGLLAGCGGGEAAAPDLSLTAAPTGFRSLVYPSAGIAFRVPANWSVTPGRSPLLVSVSSGAATIALWRYPTGGIPPRGPAQLGAALSRLTRASRGADPRMTVQRSGVSSLDGAGAVIVDALEQIDGQPRRVRSEHVYLPGAEIVLEAYAPPARFALDDHLVFSPVRRSLHRLAPTGTSRSSTSTTVAGR